MLDPVDSELYYKVLDHLPKIPPHLYANDWLGKEHYTWSQDVSFTYSAQNKSSPVIITNDIKSEELMEWLRSNIDSNLPSVLYRKVLVTPDQNFYPPHIDVRRNFALMYNLSDSGGDVVIWKEKDKPMIQQGKTLPIGTPKLFNDYRVLEEVCRFSPPVHTWYIINSQCVHSVEDIKDVREGIHIACNLHSPHAKVLNPALV
ncbi:hypothetical protein UFOVP71_146 [uncultured Caudovirales phage]|uniref:Uncharacterized protein n=1 Tax=uncultured Caudovirales phage TaxID=2100421 RepID=A0A6J5T9I8_9CAUD|nr:hypothetical protein UFOVP71_146 [uncultured Caudovirales phage]